MYILGGWKTRVFLKFSKWSEAHWSLNNHFGVLSRQKSNLKGASAGHHPFGPTGPLSTLPHTAPVPGKLAYRGCIGWLPFGFVLELANWEPWQDRDREEGVSRLTSSHSLSSSAWRLASCSIPPRVTDPIRCPVVTDSPFSFPFRSRNADKLPALEYHVIICGFPIPCPHHCK